MLTILSGLNDYAKDKYLREVVNYKDLLNTIVLEDPILADIVWHTSTPPVMSDHRDVIVYPGRKLTSSDWVVLANYIPQLSIDIRLYIVMTKVPNELREKKIGVEKSYVPIKGDKQLKSYLQSRLRDLRVTLKDDAISAFFLLAGQSELDIDNWLHHLDTVYLGQDIGVSEVRKEIPRVREITVYNIIDYMVKGNLEYTFYLLENFLANGGDWIHIGNILIWKMRQWVMCDYELNQRKSLKRQVSVTLGLSSYIVNILHRETKLFGPEDLFNYFIELIDALDEVTFWKDPTILRDIIRRICLQCNKNIA